MEIRDFKVTSVTSPQGKDHPDKQINFTCEGKGRLVDWNWIEGCSYGPLENGTWPAEWKVIIMRGGKEIKRKMKLSERSKAITIAIKQEVALYIAGEGLEQGDTKKKVTPKVDLPDIHKMDIQPKKDSLDLPEFLRR